jgi:hypothetical protein
VTLAIVLFDFGSLKGQCEVHINFCKTYIFLSPLIYLYQTLCMTFLFCFNLQFPFTLVYSEVHLQGIVDLSHSSFETLDKMCLNWISCVPECADVTMCDIHFVLWHVLQKDLCTVYNKNQTKSQLEVMLPYSCCNNCSHL